MRAITPAIQVLDMFMNGGTLSYGCNNIADAHERTAEAWTGALLALLMPQTPMNVAALQGQMIAFYNAMKADSLGFIGYASILASAIATSSVGQTQTAVADILGAFSGLLPPEVLAFLAMIPTQNPDLPGASYIITAATAPPPPIVLGSTPFSNTLLVCAGQIAAVSAWFGQGEYTYQDPFLSTTTGPWV